MSVFLKSRHLLRTAPKLGYRGLVSSTVAAQSSEAYNNTPKLSWVYQGQGHGSQSHAYSRLLAAATVAAAGLLVAGVQQADNCGIIGVVGGTDDASKYLLEGLTIMRNRGYDSAGLATINPSGKDMLFTKYASVETTSDSIDKVAVHAASHTGNHIGIAHTRWATHGGKTDENAHPHTDAGNRVAVVHNGTINNAFELQKELTTLGIQFSSQTDTEVIAQLIGLYLDKGMNTKDAVTAALERCDGSWGLAVINKSHPDEIVCACNGSPMVIGLGADGKTFVASEVTAFNRYTKNFIAMKDGEICTVHAGGHHLDITRVEKAPHHEILLTPAPYPHFTIKECLEQPEAIARALSYGARLNGRQVILGGLDRNTDRLDTIHNLMLTGCGTSLYAAQFGAKLIRDLDCFDTVTTVDAAEVRRSELPKRDGGLVAVSQSGETKDVMTAVRLGADAGVPCMSIVNTVGSLIARTTGMGVYLNAGRENAVASTKAFTSQVTVLSLVGLWFRQRKEQREGLPESHFRRQLLEALQRLPICVGMAVGLRPQCKRIAAELKDSEHLFLLGKGYGECIAMEGALKIKEMCYLHAEGYSGGALKHGPFALIDGEKGPHGATPVVCLILDDVHANLMRTTAEEVKARGARVIVITDRESLADGIDSDPIVIPSNGPLTAMIGVLPLQLIAYELAVLKGIDPDMPRNLAKAVTVD